MHCFYKKYKVYENSLMLIRKYFKLEQQDQASESNLFYTIPERICGS